MTARWHETVAGCWQCTIIDSKHLVFELRYCIRRSVQNLQVMLPAEMRRNCGPRHRSEADSHKRPDTDSTRTQWIPMRNITTRTCANLSSWGSRPVPENQCTTHPPILARKNPTLLPYPCDHLVVLLLVWVIADFALIASQTPLTLPSRLLL